MKYKRLSDPTRPNAHPASRSAPRLLALLAVAAILGGCAAGEAARREGMSLIDEGRFDQGLSKLAEAVQQAPNSAAVQKDYLRQRELVFNRWLAEAAAAHAAGNIEAAQGIYKHILAVDANQPTARQGLDDIDTERRHNKLLDEAQAALAAGDTEGARSRLALVLVEDPSDVRANKLRYQIEAPTLRENLAGPTLNIKGRKPVTLQFRDANLKMVLEAISRTTGVNVLLDKDVRNDLKVTIFVKDTPVEETIDLILLQNQLEKRVLGENTVLIYPNNPAKAKDYQELKVRRFALTNADPKQVQNMLKTILKTKDIFVDEKTNSVVIRDTPAAVHVAEKLVAGMDLPDAEVMLEVKVLEVSRQWALDLGFDWPTSGTWTWKPTDATWKGFKNRSPADIAFGIGGQFGISAAEINSNANTLAAPRLRVRNKEKAKILIGDRLPVVSSAATPATTTVGASAVYNTSIQYLETGIKLEVEPTIHADGEVAIKTNLEVSTPSAPTTNPQNGSVYYSVSTRNITTVLQLKDGETQVFGGLIQDVDQQNANKVPGLGDIPILGRLFSHYKYGDTQGGNSNKKTEVILSITPHVIRNNQFSEADLTEMWTGTEANIKFGAPNLKVASSTGVLHGAGAPAALPTPFNPAQVARGGVPQPLVAAPTPLSMALIGPQQAKVGDKITVLLNAQGTSPVGAVSFAVNYDPEALKAVAVTEGDMMRRANLKSAFDGKIESGTVTGSLTAEGGTAAAGGSVAAVQFEVVSAAGLTSLSVGNLAVTGPGGAPVAVANPPPLAVTVQAHQP